MSHNLFKDYGIGIGIRSPHYSIIKESKPKSIQWGEVISENFMKWHNGFETQSIQNLLRFREQMPIALHGVSMNLGSTDPLDKIYLKNLKELADQIDPMWISDHLCWTGVNGENLHDLNPLPYNKESTDHLVDRILRVQDYFKTRILIENVSSYIQYSHSEISEWEFIKEITTRSDCGILLDVNNVYVSSVNHNFDPMIYISSLPKERIGQIHLAGHTVKNGHLIDTHDQPVCEEVWELYNKTILMHGQISTMIERDDNIPKWDELEKEIIRAEKIKISKSLSTHKDLAI